MASALTMNNSKTSSAAAALNTNLFDDFAVNQMKDRLIVVSYNMHGYNQGIEGTREFIQLLNPDIILLQEHWLSSDNLFKLSEISCEYFVYGSSAMDTRLSTGPLVGRPFGGVATLCRKNLIDFTSLVISNDRFIVVSMASWLFINVYMPCVGTSNRLNVLCDILCNLQSILDIHPHREFIIGGDFNVELDVNSMFSSIINEFIASNKIQRTDLLYPIANKLTYVNEALETASCLDYIFTSDNITTVAFNILDLDINLSDHLPVIIVCSYDANELSNGSKSCHTNSEHSSRDTVCHFRWDHASLPLYYEQSRLLLDPVLRDVNILVDSVNTLSRDLATTMVERIYGDFVSALSSSATLTIPKHQKNFFKFWWNQELSELKSAAITSSKAWKQAGKPKHGQLFQKYKQDKLLYKKRIREERELETCVFTNDLHDALLCKSGRDFWKCWSAKFPNTLTAVQQVDGISNSALLADKFAEHFESVCQPFNEMTNLQHKARFEELMSSYHTPQLNISELFDVELISEIIDHMGNGKAAGIDGLTAEHLKFSHPCAVVILCKLFCVFVILQYLPKSFGISYTIPIPKVDGRTKSLTFNDFRGISISPTMSKVFEHAVLSRFSNYFETSDYQFGFKKKLSCSHAIYCVRNVIDHYVSHGSTVNACTLDLSKAFDKLNHYLLFIKLMERRFPLQLLNIFIIWFSMCVTCVRWDNSDSFFFKASAGVRQGGVLSPYFFALYIDDMVRVVSSRYTGCYISHRCVSIFLYADDIIIIAPSVHSLQILVNACEEALIAIDMKVNVSKSVCIRFGPRFNKSCADIQLRNGERLAWTSSCRYLGIYFTSGRQLRCLFENAKCKFYKAFNAFYSKIGRFASEEVLFNLLNTKCISVLLYGTEACPIYSQHRHSLDFTVTRIFMKLLRTGSSQVVLECQRFFSFLPVSYRLDLRTASFLKRFCQTGNSVCNSFINRANNDLLCILSKYNINDISLCHYLRTAIYNQFYVNFT